MRPYEYLLDLIFPLRGLDLRRPHWLQPPYSTPDAMNVRPYGGLPGGRQGGTRPPLSIAFAETIGTGGPIRLLASVTAVAKETLTRRSYFFHQGLSGDWQEAYVAGPSWDPPSPLVQFPLGVGVTGEGGLLVGDWAAYQWAGSTAIDRSRPYSIEASALPIEGVLNGAVSLLAGMETHNPDAVGHSAKFTVSFYTDSNTYRPEIEFSRRVDGGFPDIEIHSGEIEELPQEMVMRLEVRGNTYTGYLNGVRVVEAVASPAYVGLGVGWLVVSYENEVSSAIQNWRVRYHTADGEEEHRTLTVASADGRVYVSNLLGEMEEVASEYLEDDDGSPITDDDDVPIEIAGVTLAEGVNLPAVERLQKLYIADHGDRRLSDVVCQVEIDEEGPKVRSSAVLDWTALGIDQESHGCIVVSGDEVGPGTYRIANLRRSEMILAVGGGIGAGEATIRVERIPKVFDPVVKRLEPWIAESGQVPGGCNLMALYRDRIVLARDHLWYACRQNDPYDWDFFGADEGDSGRPIAGDLSRAGIVGQVLTALMPHSDDYMLMGCSNSLWVLRGDPGYGGQIDAVSRQVGVLGGGAWTPGPSGETYFLSRSGFFVVSPGGVGELANLSSERIPGAFSYLDADYEAALLAYDSHWKGIHIYLPRLAGDHAATHYWFDVEGRGFWPLKHAVEHEPMLLGWRPASNRSGEVLLGCRDGVIRRYVEGGSSDSGQPFESWVVMGPFLPSEKGLRDGMLAELRGTMSAATYRVNWSVSAGDNAAEAVGDNPKAEGTWRGGANPCVRSRVRGYAFSAKLSSWLPGFPWQMERLVCRLRVLGRKR